jgi:hypothetical protein
MLPTKVISTWTDALSTIVPTDRALVFRKHCTMLRKHCTIVCWRTMRHRVVMPARRRQTRKPGRRLGFMSGVRKKCAVTALFIIAFTHATGSRTTLDPKDESPILTAACHFPVIWGLRFRSQTPETHTHTHTHVLYFPKNLKMLQKTVLKIVQRRGCRNSVQMRRIVSGPLCTFFFSRCSVQNSC